MKKIPLTQGKFALVDDEDYEWLSQWKWCAVHARGRWYAVRSYLKKRCLWMHREIMKCPVDKEIDHISGNGLDNRKANLRICTHRENCQNRRPNKNGTSTFKGVYWYSRIRKWTAIICNGKERIFLGNFLSEKEAARRYAIASRKYNKRLH